MQISRKDERSLHVSTLTNIIQTHTYGSEVREFKVGSIHLQNIASGFSKNIHTEAHPLLDKTHKRWWEI